MHKELNRIYLDVREKSRDQTGRIEATLPSYLSTRSLSPPTSVTGASQLMLSSELFTLVILTLLTKLGTLASVVTVMSTYSDFPANADTPFSANTWNRYVVTALRPVIVIFVSLKTSCSIEIRVESFRQRQSHEGKREGKKMLTVLGMYLTPMLQASQTTL